MRYLITSGVLVEPALGPRSWVASESVLCVEVKRNAFLVVFIIVVSLLNHVQLFFDTMDHSPPGSSVHGISQAGMLEWKQKCW